MHQRLVSALLFIQSYFDIFMDSSLQAAVNKSGVQTSPHKLVQEISSSAPKAARAKFNIHNYIQLYSENRQ